MGLVVATKAFFKLMFNRELSDSFQQLVDGKALQHRNQKPLLPNQLPPQSLSVVKPSAYWQRCNAKPV